MVKLSEHLTPADWALTRPQHVNAMQLLSNGLTYQEIAIEMSYSYRYVKHMMKTTRDELDAQTVYHAVAVAMRLEIIE